VCFILILILSLLVGEACGQPPPPRRSSSSSTGRRFSSSSSSTGGNGGSAAPGVFSSLSQFVVPSTYIPVLSTNTGDGSVDKQFNILHVIGPDLIDANIFNSGERGVCVCVCV
jgi:hypothetical protein